jgi:hypothetical protein
MVLDESNSPPQRVWIKVSSSASKSVVKMIESHSVVDDIDHLTQSLGWMLVTWYLTILLDLIEECQGVHHLYNLHSFALELGLL